MTSNRFAGAFAFLLSASSPGAAGETTEIVVSAPSRNQEVLKREVATFARRVADNSAQEQFARRGSSYCPRVIGLPAPYERIVLTKLASAASAVEKIRLEAAGCKPDIFVIFTSDGADLIDRIHAKNPAFFGALSPEVRDSLFKSKAPVKWWYGTEIRGADGEPMVDAATYRTRSSLISSGLAISLTSTVVIVDIGLSEGYPLDSIASFAAMVAFAQVRQPDERLGESPSILGIFHRSTPRLSALRNLTLWDKAYLRALYRIPKDRPLWQQRLQLSGAMVEAINAQAGATAP